MVASLTKSIRKAREKSNAVAVMPGIDSKAAYPKLRQYLITMPGSENISEIKGPRLDSARICFMPIKAKTDKNRKITNRPVKKPRYLFTRMSSFSKPKRFIMREKRPRGTSED